jgi:hypothetical protein
VKENGGDDFVQLGSQQSQNSHLDVNDTNFSIEEEDGV